MTEVVETVQISDSTAGAERLRRLRGILTSSRNGLVDLEERVRMHWKNETNYQRKLEIFLFI